MSERPKYITCPNCLLQMARYHDTTEEKLKKACPRCFISLINNFSPTTIKDKENFIYSSSAYLMSHHINHVDVRLSHSWGMENYYKEAI